jgi:hypothetical protein
MATNEKSSCWRCGGQKLVALTLPSGPTSVRLSLFCSSCGVRCSGHKE